MSIDYSKLNEADKLYQRGKDAMPDEHVQHAGGAPAIKRAIDYYSKATALYEEFIDELHESAKNKALASYPQQANSDSNLKDAIGLYGEAIGVITTQAKEAYWALETAKARAQNVVNQEYDIESDNQKVRRSIKLARLLYGRGNAKYLLGKYKEAIGDYAEVSEIYPERLTHTNNPPLSLALYNKGNAYEALGDDAKAEEAHTDAFRWSPFKQDYVKGNAYSGIFRYEDAVKCYTASITADGIADAYFNRGVARLKLNDPQGRDDIEEAINRDSKLADSDQNKFLDRL